MFQKLKFVFYKNEKIIYILLLSIIFTLTIQQFEMFKGNANHLIHSIKNFDDNKLQYDWIANQQHHLPLFVYFNQLLIKFFSKDGIYIVHFLLLTLTSFYLFLISQELFPKLKKNEFKIIWFAIFIFIFHENSFFSGVAGQSSIDAGYQPASFSILFFIGIYFFLIDKNYLSILFICLGASFHPTYVLHSGFLVLGILVYNLLSKKYLDCLKIILCYSLLILPITIFIILNFFTIDKNLILIGQEILLERIPHHANIYYWLTYKDIFSLLTFFYALYLIRGNNRFFIFFTIFGLCPISLTLTQYFININSLALAFPWRSSVFINPISTIIILSYFVEKIKLEGFKLKIISYFLIIVIAAFFSTKSHYIKDENNKFKNKLILTEKIKKNFNLIERILIPTNLDYIRMNSGLPIFIDWKHHAFRYDQIIKWKQRVNLADDFYNSKSENEKLFILEKIQDIENISHILIKKDELKINCNNLINHKEFALVSVKDCYEVK